MHEFICISWMGHLHIQISLITTCSNYYRHKCMWSKQSNVLLNLEFQFDPGQFGSEWMFFWSWISSYVYFFFLRSKLTFKCMRRKLVVYLEFSHRVCQYFVKISPDPMEFKFLFSKSHVVSTIEKKSETK